MKYIAWIGTLTSILGSFAVAFGFMFMGYTLFLVGSFCWLATGIVNRDKPLIVLNATFFVANLIGFARNF